MKDIELGLVSELIKNSRRSDRELAKSLGTSQPTVSRTIQKLEKQGIVKEYTVMPDLFGLGFQLASFTLASLDKPVSPEISKDILEHSNEIEETSPSPVLIAMNGIGCDADYVIIALHKDYSEYVAFMEYMKHFPHVQVDKIRSFLVDLDNKNHFRNLTLSAVANYLARSRTKTPSSLTREKMKPKQRREGPKSLEKRLEKSR